MNKLELQIVINIITINNLKTYYYENLQAVKERIKNSSNRDTA